MPPGDPAPIQGRWTIARHWIARVRIDSAVGEREHVVHDAAYAEQLRGDGGWEVAGPFVPVPDEAAIERGAKAMQRAETSHSESYMRWLLDIGLRAALEAPEGPS